MEGEQETGKGFWGSVCTICDSRSARSELVSSSSLTLLFEVLMNLSIIHFGFPGRIINLM
jgi:hypothetical protein